MAKGKPGRKPDGDSAGKRINIYFTEPREELFERAFDLLKTKGMLPSIATLRRSRTEVIDFALDALIAKLEDED